MSLDKAIASGKEKRKPYYDSRRFDHSCKNHGACSYCAERRQFAFKKDGESSLQELAEFEKGYSEDELKYIFE